MTENDNELVELVADFMHDQWSHWMKYMYSKTFEFSDNLKEIKHKLSDGEWFGKTDGLFFRWHRQMNTAYAELSEKEKDSDREWARKLLHTIRTRTLHYTKVAKDTQPVEFSSYELVEWENNGKAI